MTDTWHGALERAEQKHREVQNRILAIPGTQRVLRKLTKAGASQDKILSLLASAVSDRKFWLPPLRRKKKQLESFADQLETVAKYTQRAALDPSSYGPFWLAVMGWGKWEDIKSPKTVPNNMVGSMRRYAEYCREKAKAFGNLLRQAPCQKREMTDLLLIEVWLKTRKHYDKEMAFLLTNAFEAVGKKRECSEDQIKKHRQRYVMPTILAYLRSHPQMSGPESQKGTVRTP